MAVFNLPKEFDPSWPGPGVKPTGKIEIDWSHSLAPDELCVLLGREVVDLVSGLPLTLGGGSPDYAIDDGEESRSFNGAVEEFYTVPEPITHHTGTSEWSITFKCNPGTVVDDLVLLGKNGVNSNYVWIRNEFYFRLKVNGINHDTGYYETSLGVPHWFTIVFKSDGSFDLYEDGEYVNSSNAVSAGAFELHDIGASYTSTAYAYGGSLTAVYAHSWPLTADNIRSLHSDPYQILKPISDEVYLTEEADDGTTTVITAPANSLWAAVNASINAQTEIATSPPNAVWAAINTSINATTIVSTIPPNSTWVAVNAVIETTAGGATIVTTPPNSTWLGVNASINAKTEIATTPHNSVWAGVNADINASTIIDTSAPNAQWATFATVIEADAVISTTPPNSTWAGINANVLVVSPDADQPTGGWDYPQKPDPYEERVRQGIIQPDEPKKKVKLVQRVEQIPVDFEQIKSLEQAEQQRAELKELQRLHETIKRRGIKKAQKEQLDREVLTKITLALNLLEQQKQLIEEQDIVFVMMMLAA